MSDAYQRGRAADQLSQVLLALEDVNLNALMDDEVRDVLEFKSGIREIALRARQDERSGEPEFEWVGQR